LLHRTEAIEVADEFHSIGRVCLVSAEKGRVLDGAAAQEGSDSRQDAGLASVVLSDEDQQVLPLKARVLDALEVPDLETAQAHGSPPWPLLGIVLLPTTLPHENKPSPLPGG